MHSSALRRSLGLGLATAALVGVQATGALAADPPTRTLVPIGSDYQPDTLQLFAREAAERTSSTNADVHILVLPITYSLSADGTTKSERKKNLTFADNRRGQVEAACIAVKAPSQTCTVQLVPVLVRSDAVGFDPAPYFEPDLDGMYILGGDQTVAMNLLHDTPLEAAMTDAFEAGAVVSGNSAGDAVQSRDMINGYYGDNGPAESMREGAVQVCHDSGPTDCEGGLPFGFPNLITDQHVFEYGRTGRSLNVALETGKPVLGMDAATGAVVTDYLHLRDVTGDTLGYVVDPGAYDATATWAGPNETLAMRNVALHLLPEGSGFEFGTMTPSPDGTPIAKPDIAGRGYPAFATGVDAGPLFLSGAFLGDPAGAVGQSFVTAAGGSTARIVVLAAGYGKSGTAQADAKAIRDALAPSVASVSWFALDSRTKTADAVAAIGGATGIVVTGQDRSLVMGQLLASDAWTAARARWTDGDAALLMDDAAAAAAGAQLVAEPNAADVEGGAIEDALGVTTGPGLGLVSGLSVEPRLLPDQLWPQLFQLAKASGTRAVAAGIDVLTAIRVDGGSASTVGDSAAVIVDGRQATWTTGGNGAIGGAWVLVDSFVDGQAVAP
jgi:cyanophycinase-like exopeptidase